MSDEAFNNYKNIPDDSLFLKARLNNQTLLEKLSSYPVVIDLPYEKTVLPKDKQKIILPAYNLRQSVYDKLKKYSQMTGYPIFDFLKAAFGSLISHYSNQDKLALICLFEGEQVYLHDNNNTLVEALCSLNINSMPVVDLPENIREKISLSVAIEHVNHDKEFSSFPNSFDILLTCHESDNLFIQVTATKHFFSNKLLQQLGTHMESMLECSLNDANAPLKQLSCLSSEEQKNILYTFNDHGRVSPATRSILECFDEQVNNTPHTTAIIFEDIHLTYLQLNERANQLAWSIRKEYFELTGNHLLPDTFIAMCLERNLETVIGILGILKAGGAYVPIDPSYPDERIAFILKDTKSPMVLTQGHLSGKLNAINPNIKQMALDEPVENQNKNNLDINPGPHDAAYVIYTSGTTGIPKGVVQSHGNVTRLFRETDEYYHFNHQDVWTLFHSYVFDFSVWELWGALFYGGKLIIPNHQETRDTRSFHDLCEKYQVTILNQTPSAFYQFQEEARERNKLLKLRYVIFGGEPLNVQQLQPWWSQYGDKQPTLVNMYGITETTVHVTYKTLSMDDVTRGSNIGKPIRDLKLYVLDKNLQPSAIGVTGELYVGGAGLAKGYLNRPELTQERFINNPFVTETDVKNGYNRLYKTGDLVRWEADGTIQYIGRNDFQVKLRGFRIELGEIESVLSSYPGVKQCLVLLTERKENPFLIGYYVADLSLNSTEIRTYLGDYLPEYMIPTLFVHLESFPLTINGKLDKTLLPKPELNAVLDDAAPKNDLEFALRNIWQEVFGFEQIGVRTSFFSIGGHSILLMQLILKIRNCLKKIISPSEIFQYQTIEQQAELISGRQYAQEEQAHIIHDNQNRFESFPLTDIQHAYLLGRTNTFALGGIQSHIYIENEQEGIDIDRLEEALNCLIARHDMLRAIILDDGTQKITADVPFYKIQRHEGNVTAVRESIIRKFKQENPFPLFEVRATTLNEDKCVIHFYFDLLIADGTGLEVIFKELSNLYDYPQSIVAKPTISYRDVILALEKKGDAYEAAKAYWLARLDSIPEAPELPTRLLSKDDCPPFVRRKGSLSATQWHNFKKVASKIKVTPAVLLLTIYGEILKEWSKSAKFTLNLMFFNRPRFHPDIDRVVGNFSTTLLLEMNLKGQNGIEEKAKRIQEQLLQDLEHSEFNGINVLSELNRRQGGASTAAMPVVFACALNLTNSLEFNYSKRFKWYGSGVSYSHLETPQVWFDHQVFEDDDGSFCFFWDVREDYFPEGLVDKMFHAYQNALRETAQDFASPLALLPPSDYCLIQEVNNTTASIKPACLHAEIFQHAKRMPDKPAILTSKISLSYKEMAATALFLKDMLATHAIKPQDNIIILMEKGWEQIVAALGILAAGAVYIPVDSALPEERIRQIVAISASKAIVVQKKPDFDLDIPVLVMNEIKQKLSFECIQEPLQAPDDLAYIIFTSGSTGTPKGVMITHGAAFNTIAAINQKYKITEHDRAFAISSFSFDLSVFDAFGLLQAGGSLFIPTGDEPKNPEYWMHHLLKQNVTIWNSAPALMQLLIERAELESFSENSLRLVMMSGDWIPVQLPDHIKSYFKADVVSLGGATEASIWSNDYLIQEVKSNWISIPYGKPLPNQTMYILDEDLKHRAIWATGWIYIGGLGLAKGYLGDKDKTANSFIWHPEMQQTLYRTGDLGRLCPDGNIEFLGREDLQVKVQGHRIELEEIESIICKTPFIDQSIVRIIGDNESKRIIAFFTAKKEIETESLKKELEDKLPYYMIPNQFLQLKTLSLTSNGKVDIRALVKLSETASIKKSQAYEAPEGGLENQMAEIWMALLSAPMIGRNDNFFALGGTSFLAFQMIHQVQKKMGLSLSLSALFQKGSIRELLETEISTKKSSLVILQSTGEREPFFFVHPSGGGVLCYSELMKHLGKHHPFYGFQSQGYMDSVPLLTTVEQMAAHYLRILLKEKPKGDFWLGGWSFGGVVAFEMAHQLTLMGRSIKPLLLIDSPAPMKREMPDDQRLHAWFQADYGEHYSRLDEQNKSTLFRVFKNNIEALSNYIPEKRAVDIIQFKAEKIYLEQLKHHPASDENDWGWRSFSTGHISTYCFEADHSSILQPPEVEKLADILATIKTRFF